MKLVILDRDGVINQDSDAYVKSADEWIPIDGSIEAIAKLYKAGFTVVVATNQSGLARGLFDLDDLEAMHDKLTQLVIDAGGELGAIFYCPHGPDDNCNCRKPKAGLIDAIEAEFDVSASSVPLVGDSLRDLEAGLQKGCDPILVLTGKGEKMQPKLAATTGLEHTPHFANLAEAADHIIERYS
jgi:D-glycero-D-manno-heptose 1,7-bisphosphate phosphatase